MKIAITGYRGFIGSALMAEAARRNIIAVGVEPTDRGDFDVVYHLACPATPNRIINDTVRVMDSIMDATRDAILICPSATFVNASSQGAAHPLDGRMREYNVAKLCMEMYLQHANPNTINYRLPAVYGAQMNREFFIPRCIDGTAYQPSCDRAYQIAHIDDVVNSLITLSPVQSKHTTLLEVYQRFSSGEWTLDTRFNK